jgi:transketolase
METMRERFTSVTTELLAADPRLALVLADITADAFAPARRRYPDRVLNLGIREQLLVSVAGGLALAGCGRSLIPSPASAWSGRSSRSSWT